MFVCVVLLSQPSRVIINGFGICYMLNVKCLCVLSCYLNPVEE